MLENSENPRKNPKTNAKLVIVDTNNRTLIGLALPKDINNNWFTLFEACELVTVTIPLGGTRIQKMTLMQGLYYNEGTIDSVEVTASTITQVTRSVLGPAAFDRVVQEYKKIRSKKVADEVSNVNIPTEEDMAKLIGLV